MSDARFIRQKEDFTCLQCGVSVVGDGYTNHCPVCLWSKHVDVHPGDRKESCQGLMKPSSVIEGGGEYRIEHVCVKCGYAKKNLLAPNDDFEMVISLAKKVADE